ncbi:tyrosine-type recombinase/integrase [Chromatocurvus halotolerans]|uniref:Site-specific recombinase XerD n=2 Tax=Chromatocurvus halotolerans TaxID=1132028 RepID=A0A4R2KUA8_9GAMM|nr:site-specific integrase [Chromatocurvus halotolerans]TCO73768.1 site-specific recombinase XerD [Chromatocurvus halotolerans]
MAKQRLTQKFVDRESLSKECHKKEFYDTDCIGLFLEVRSGRKSYYLRYRDERGKNRRKVLGRADVLQLTDARNMARRYLRDIQLGQNPFEEKAALKDVPTFNAFVHGAFMPHIKGYKRSWRSDESLLRNHILPAVGHLHLDEIKRHHLVSLFAKHREDHKPGSTNRVMILCRYILNCAINWETPGIEANPSKGIALLPENNKRERYLSQDESKRLFTALEHSDNPSLKYIVALLLLTGARKREVLDARWEDFDLQRRIWTIEFNKLGRPRYIPIADGVARVLEQVSRHEGCPWVFANPKTGKPFVSIYYSWNTARVEAGLPEVRMHDLRHSFASFLINSGRSLYEVQKILGHTQVKTTQRYAHLSQESLIAAANTAGASVPFSGVPTPPALPPAPIAG